MLPFALFLTALAAAEAQTVPRSLHWRALDVEARLDSEGRLHVRERHAMVFTGDWNGGERTFRLRWDHELRLEGIERENPETHSLAPLTENADLSRVNDFTWADSKTLRWRSRLPSDPPFQDSEIVYVLDYTLDNVLIPKGDGYLLDHDFAFPDRPGPILSFSLELSFDDAWRPKQVFSGRVTRKALPPGASVVVTLPLAYEGAGSLPAVRTGAAWPSRLGLMFVLGGAALAIGSFFYRGEDGLGRFAPLTPIESIDERWLEEHVFSMLPEEVGAAWDDSTAAPEVAAVLARMVSEGKLQTEVYRTKSLLGSGENLRMKLLVDRKTLQGYESSLVRALFVSGDETNTVMIRRHYESQGFDPASKLREPLKRNVARILGNPGAPRQISRKAALLLLAASVVALSIAALVDRMGFVSILPALGVALLLYIAGFIAAAIYRKRVERLLGFSATFLVPAAALLVTAFFYLYFNPGRAGALALLGLSFLVLSFLTSLFNAAKFRNGSNAIEVRKKLASARRYFAFELSRRNPRLDDRWFPYLLAFELGPNVDRWFRAHGGSTSPDSSGSPSSTHVGSSTSTSESRSPWTGGGGAFGGAGATGSWAAAAGSMAAGVAAPSSSSSDGGGSSGGGSGGSSGGGGGGGW